MKSKSEFQLHGDELKLFKLIREGPYDKIFPELVIKVSKSLKQQKQPRSVNSSFSQDTLDPTRREIGAIAEVAKGIFRKLKLKWTDSIEESPTYQPSFYSFVPHLCAKDVFLMKNQGKIIKRVLPCITIIIQSIRWVSLHY